MKKLLIAVLCLLLPCAAFSEGEWEVETSTAARAQRFDYKGFTAVETGWGIDVDIVQSRDYNVELFADDTVRDRIQVECFGRRLRIGVRNQFPWGWSLGRARARVEIRMPIVEELNASGGSRLDVDMDNGAGDLIVRLSGGSVFRGNVRTTGAFSIQASGGSSSEIEGGAASLRLNGTGGSRYRLPRFSTGELNAELSGGSSAEVAVSGALSVNASGGSHVVYYGDPRIQRQNLSGGSWTRHD